MAPWLSKLHGKFLKNFAPYMTSTTQRNRRQPAGAADPRSATSHRAGACKTGDMRITVLAGGIGAARFLRGLLAAAPDADDHRHRQHRRRHHPVRPAGLPGPGLGDVHARRRQQRGAGLGARGRDASASAKSSPPTARSRPGSRSATATSPRTSCAASCSPTGLPLSEVTRQLCAALAAGRPAAPDVRRPDRNPRQDQHADIERTLVSPRRQAEDLIHFQEWWVRLHAAVPA